MSKTSDSPLPKAVAPKAVALKPKNKSNPHAPSTKAEHAALKRVDKMVIKRMRKR